MELRSKTHDGMEMREIWAQTFLTLLIAILAGLALWPGASSALVISALIAQILLIGKKISRHFAHNARAAQRKI